MTFRLSVGVEKVRVEEGMGMCVCCNSLCEKEIFKNFKKFVETFLFLSIFLPFF